MTTGKLAVTASGLGAPNHSDQPGGTGGRPATDRAQEYGRDVRPTFRFRSTTRWTGGVEHRDGSVARARVRAVARLQRGSDRSSGLAEDIKGDGERGTAPAGHPLRTQGEQSAWQ